MARPANIASNSQRGTAVVLLIALLAFVFVNPLASAGAAQDSPALFYVVNYTYKNSVGGDEIYPGSRGVSLTFSVKYQGDVELYVSAGCIELPPGFSPSRGYSTCSPPYTPGGEVYGVVKPGDVVNFRYTIDVGSAVVPGPYTVNLAIYYRTGSTTQEERVEGIEIFVSPYPQVVIEVADWYWGPSAYPGSEGVYLYLTLENEGEGDVVEGRGLVELPQDLVTPHIIRFSVANLRAGYATTVAVGPLSVSPDAEPEVPYAAKIRLNATALTEDGVTFNTTAVAEFPLSLQRPPSVNLQLIDYGVEGSRVSEGVRGARLYATFVSKDFKSLRTIIAHFSIVSPGARFANGSNRDVVILQGVVDYGGSFTIISDPLVTDLGVSTVTVVLRLIMLGEDNGAEFWSVQQYTISIPLSAPFVNLRVVKVYWQSQEVYPGSDNCRLAVVVFNEDLVNVRDLVATLKLPHPLHPSTVVARIDGVPSGAFATLTFTDISVPASVQPGTYRAELEIQGVAVDPRTNAFFDFSAKLPLSVIVNPTPNIMKVEVVGYWGAPTPGRALAGQRNAPITIQVMNWGPYPIRGMKVSASPLNKSINMPLSEQYCSPPLVDVGGSCTVTLYADLGGVLRGGKIALSVRVEYAFTINGINVIAYTERLLPLLVDEGATGYGLEPFSVRWANGWPVYPETRNATLIITLANRWPYRVSSIRAELMLPEGFSLHPSAEVSYVPGPVSPGQQVELAFIITVGAVKPGRYGARLLLDYVVESGTPGLRFTEERKVSLVINDPLTSISVLSASWVGGVPEPETHGALLLVVIRNNHNPVIRGATLILELPPGIAHADTNSSVAVALPTSVNVGLAPLAPAAEPYLATLWQMIAGTQQVQEVFDYGDVMHFYVKLNVYEGVVDPTLTGYLEFVDHWNNVRKIPVKVALPPVGAVKVIRLHAPTAVKVIGGLARISLGIENEGSAPVYNVYVAMIPQAPMLVPIEAVKHVGTLRPHAVVHVHYELVYNPASIASAGVQAFLRYMSVPFVVSVVYRDVAGNVKFFNTTLALMVEPFVELRFEDVKVSLTRPRLVASGTVTNYGIATARSVEVKLVCGNAEASALVGDLDPASKSAFRVSLTVEGEPCETVTLIAVYRDEYGNLSSVRTSVHYVEAPPEAATPTPAKGLTTVSVFNVIVVVVATALFLAAVGFAIYRYIRAHSKRLEALPQT